jgi:hypothetical protein
MPTEKTVNKHDENKETPTGKTKELFLKFALETITDCGPNDSFRSATTDVIKAFVEADQLDFALEILKTRALTRLSSALYGIELDLPATKYEP